MSQKNKILLIKADAESKIKIQNTLNSDFEIYSIDSLLEAHSKIKNNNWDLIFLDIDSNDNFEPILNFSEIYLGLNKNLNILFLTSNHTLQKKNQDFNLDVHDFLCKPINPLELRAKVLSLINNYKVLQYGPLFINENTHQVKVLEDSQSQHEIEIFLTPLEFKILHTFLQKPEKVFSRKELVQLIWDNRFLTSRTVDRHICSLRQKLLNCGKYLQTIKSFGYKLTQEPIHHPENLNFTSNNSHSNLQFNSNKDSIEKRIRVCSDITQQFISGNFYVNPPVNNLKDELSYLELSLFELGHSLSHRFDQIQKLSEVTNQVNYGILLDEVLSYIFNSFHTVIPYDRIGFALIKNDSSMGKIVESYWVKTKYSDKNYLDKGYREKLAGSSLETIISTKKPRIINNLNEYLENHPNSVSTQLILKDQVHSSLTCPIISLGQPIGFLFFSSTLYNTYKDIHCSIFTQISTQLSIIIEKGQMYQTLIEQSEIKKQLLGVACHDIRTPLFITNEYLYLIQNGHLGPVTQDLQDATAVIKRSTHQALKIVDDILDSNSIENGKIELNLEKIDVHQFLYDFVKTSKILLNPKSMELTLNILSELPPLICDPLRVNQVLNSLLWSFINSSQQNNSIHIDVEKKDNFLKITFKNSFNNNKTSQVFHSENNIYNKDSLNHYNRYNQELSLMISKRMIEMHGGKIHEISNDNHHQINSITLPLTGPTSILNY